ncbi:unnamed protein product, partial [Brugia timori]|uniref:Pecanex-like protein n=1 Tax=Brugia timori TaxID=42155 RepID=A0A0R3QNJ1_9BILA
FWTSDIAQEISGSSQKHSDLESSSVRYSSKRRSSFTKHYVSNATSGSSVSKRANEKRVNSVINACMGKGVIASGTYILHMTSLQNNSGIGDVSTQTISGRRSLLRHIFRSESSSNAISGSDNGTSNGNGERDAETKPVMINLAQCRAFTPLKEQKITSSQSALALSSTSSLSTQHDANSLQSYIADQSADCLILERNQHAVPSLRTFKPGRSANGVVTQEEVQKLNGSNSHFRGISFAFQGPSLNIQYWILRKLIIYDT